MVKAVRMMRTLSEISLPGAGGFNLLSNIWVVGRIGYSSPDFLRTYQTCGILNTVSLNSDLQPETFPVERLKSRCLVGPGNTSEALPENTSPGNTCSRECGERPGFKMCEAGKTYQPLKLVFPPQPRLLTELNLCVLQPFDFSPMVDVTYNMPEAGLALFSVRHLCVQVI
jgi:hypothetical protein